MIQRSMTFGIDLFLSSSFLHVSTRMYTPLCGNDVIANGMFHQRKLKKCVDEFNC